MCIFWSEYHLVHLGMPKNWLKDFFRFNILRTNWVMIFFFFSNKLIQQFQMSVFRPTWIYLEFFKSVSCQYPKNELSYQKTFCTYNKRKHSLDEGVSSKILSRCVRHAQNTSKWSEINGRGKSTTNLMDSLRIHLVSSVRRANFVDIMVNKNLITATF